MAMFHPRCGQRITLIDDNRTAIRNFSEFNYGLVLSSQPLADNQLFEVRIEKKVSVLSKLRLCFDCFLLYWRILPYRSVEVPVWFMETAFHPFLSW